MHYIYLTTAGCPWVSWSSSYVVTPIYGCITPKTWDVDLSTDEIFAMNVLVCHLQAQCLFNLSGDAVTLKCSDVQVSRTGSPEQPMNTMQLLDLPTSDAAPVQANTSSGGAKETLLYRVTEL